MKRYLFVVLTLILFTLSLNSQTTFKYTSSNLNLRSVPNMTSQVLTVLPKGTKVTMEENCDCEWIRVSYYGEVGYVYSKYLTNRKINNSKTYYSKTVNRDVTHYTNSSGERVQSPTYYNSSPAGATALCWDGTYSFSRSRRGTCSHHGGVAEWLN